MLITSSLTINSFSCFNLFYGVLITPSNVKTGGDKPSNKNTGTTGNTDGKIEGDKPSNKKTETTGTTEGKTKGLFHSFLWWAYHLQFYHQ
jgi:hypothetical protein